MSLSAASSQATMLKATFWVLGIFGTVVTWGRVMADGSVAILQTALEDPDYVLPGTNSSLRQKFTGVFPVDYLLRTLVVFFWEAVDGSHPKNSAVGIYFGSQLFPIIVAVYLDNQRKGNVPSLLRPSLWFLVFSAAAIGCSGAAWALLYTSTSPTVSPSISLDALKEASLVTSPLTASLLLPAAALCYALPLILMGLPSPALVSNNFQQWAIVAWNMFPLFLLTAVRVGEPLAATLLPPARRPPPDPVQAHLRAVRWLGAGAIAAGFAMHVAVAAISASAALFPALFAEGYAEALRPLALAVPPVAVTPAASVGDGVWGFMLWDQVAGFALVMLVMLAQLRNAMQRQLGYFSWGAAGLGCLLLSFIVGPGATIMAVSWAREEVLYSVKATTRPSRKA